MDTVVELGEEGERMTAATITAMPMMEMIVARTKGRFQKGGSTPEVVMAPRGCVPCPSRAAVGVSKGVVVVVTGKAGTKMTLSSFCSDRKPPATAVGR